MIKKIVLGLLVSTNWALFSEANEFVVSKPIAKKIKRMTCSQLKEEIAQNAAQILTTATDAVGDYAAVLAKKLKKTQVQCCAQTLEAVAGVQHDMLTIISNMITPEKNSVWERVTREQLTAMHALFAQYVDEIAKNGDNDCSEKLSVQVLPAKKTWWLELQRQVSACLPHD